MHMLDNLRSEPLSKPLDDVLGLHPVCAHGLYSGPADIFAAEFTAFAKINGPLEGNGRFYQRPDIY
ncbi:hypothetical protein P7L78_26720 [Tistrella bauzanensis]|uniref:Uncharacterized protein n=1 Tax=Tistrella arctica TaxID=3133430 RepID=A0ABU9YH03_9PROT